MTAWCGSSRRRDSSIGCMGNRREATGNSSDEVRRMVRPPIKSYKDLIVWQRALDLVEAVYRITANLPTSEQWGLTSQSSRAAVSAPTNIAEGYGRQSTREYRHRLSIARLFAGIGDPCIVMPTTGLFRRCGFEAAIGRDRRYEQNARLF